MATCPTLRLSSDSKYLTGRAAEDPDSKYFMRGNGNSPLLCPSPTSNILIYGNWKPEDSQSIPSIISHDFKSQSLPILLIWQLGCTFFFFLSDWDTSTNLQISCSTWLRRLRQYVVSTDNSFSDKKAIDRVIFFPLLLPIKRRLSWNNFTSQTPGCGWVPGTRLLDYPAVVFLFASAGQQLVFIRRQIMIHAKKKMVKTNKERSSGNTVVCSRGCQGEESILFFRPL